MTRDWQPTSLLARTDVGRVREINEDSVLAWQRPAGCSSPLGIDALLAVADGMGGHESGEVASRMAVERLERVLTADSGRPELATADELSDYLSQTVVWINEQIYNLGDPESGRRPGTTLTALVVRDGQFVLAHVGDSRAYRVGHSAIELLSDDHSYVAEQVRAQRMSPEMARTSPFRGQLTRSIGSSAALQVDLRTGVLAPGDFLLVCSDGLTEYVRDAELAVVIHDAPDLATAAETLIAMALERGGADNVSVVLGRFGEPARPDAAQQVAQRAATLPSFPAAVAVAAEPARPRTNGHAGRILEPLPPPRRRLNPLILVASAIAVLLVGLGLGLGRRPPEPPPQRTAPPLPATPGAPTRAVEPVVEPPAPPPQPEILISAEGKDLILRPAPDERLDWNVKGTGGYEASHDASNRSYRIRLKGDAHQTYRLVTVDGEQVGTDKASDQPRPWPLETNHYRLMIGDKTIVEFTPTRLPAATSPAAAP